MTYAELMNELQHALQECGGDESCIVALSDADDTEYLITSIEDDAGENIVIYVEEQEPVDDGD